MLEVFPLEVFPPDEQLRRRRRQRQAILAGGLLVVVALAMYFTDWPWFAINAAILLAFAAAISIPRVRRFLSPGAPWTPWSVLALLTCAFVVHSYYIELLQQRSDRFDVLGVRFPLRPDSIFTIGADDSMDVRLEMPADSLTRWRLKLRKVDGGFSALSMEGVDAIQQAEPGSSRIGRLVREIATGGRKEWQHKVGWPLSDGAPPAHVTSQTNPQIKYQLEIRTRGGIPFLSWNNDSVPLQLSTRNDPGAEVHNARLMRRLRSGIRLDELPWKHIPDTAAAQNLVLFLVRVPPASLSFIPAFNKYRFQLTSRSANWRIGADSTAQTAPLLTPRDSIQVSANGYRWVFAVDIAHTTGYGSGQVAVSFGRGPRPNLGWLPASGVCRPASRCTLVSNRHLPPAIPYFDISGFGLDTTRFGFLARVSLADNTLNIVTPRLAYSAQSDTAVTIPAQPIRLGDEASYRLRIFRIANGGFMSLLLTLSGLVFLVVGLARTNSIRSRVGVLLRQDTLAVNTAWAIASVSVVLLGMRLALGYRVTYATPYAPRGADTAIGMCVTVIILTAALMNWPSWGPPIVRWLLKVERATPAATGMVRAEPARVGLGAEYRVSAARSGIARFGDWTLVALGIGLVASQRFKAVGESMAIAVLVLGCWVVLEYLASQQTQASVARSPGEVVGMEEADRDWGRWIALGVMTFGILGSVWLRGFALPATLFLVVLLPLIAFALRIMGKKEKVKIGGRWGAIVMVSLFLLGLNVVLIAFEGPTLLFVAVFFLFLLGVRLGHHVGISLYKRDPWPAFGAVAVFVIALLMVLPIDFGLMLVLGVPLAAAFIITLDPSRVNRWVLGAIVLVLVGGAYFFVRPVLYPDASSISKGQAASQTSEAFNRLGGPLAGLPFANRPVHRSVVRALAAQRPDALELVLARAGPSLTREQVVPAIEQIWGGRAYAASGSTGKGLAHQTVIGRGIATAVSYAENTFSVYVLAEHGFFGGLVVILAYVTLLVVAIVFVWRAATARDRPVLVPNATAVAVVVGGVLMLTVPALYVAAANIAVVPLTGQNMPFLGLNAWSDVAFVSALLSAMFALLLDTSALDVSALDLAAT